MGFLGKLGEKIAGSRRAFSEGFGELIDSVGVGGGRGAEGAVRTRANRAASSKLSPTPKTPKSHDPSAPVNWGANSNQYSTEGWGEATSTSTPQLSAPTGYQYSPGPKGVQSTKHSKKRVSSTSTSPLSPSQAAAATPRGSNGRFASNPRPTVPGNASNPRPTVPGNAKDKFFDTRSMWHGAYGAMAGAAVGGAAGALNDNQSLLGGMVKGAAFGAALGFGARKIARQDTAHGLQAGFKPRKDRTFAQNASHYWGKNSVKAGAGAGALMGLTGGKKRNTTISSNSWSQGTHPMYFPG